uniref:ShKT domain-containing protein n=1 Tax=Panagrellus redivivus TaxID=6233 RepID=A0A7E4W878_PANRE
MFHTIAIVFLACGIASVSASSTSAGSTELRCQYDNGTLKATATVCTDTLSDCQTIFGGNATGTTRPVLCDNDDMQDKAAQCAKTCGICCEQPAYDCLDSTVSPINCTTNKRYCNNGNWTDVMAQYCPATCGLCMNGSCSDNLAGCSSMAALCENVNWYSYMQTNCARTCGTCSSTGGTGSSCSDVASNCAATANLCNNSVYYSLMTTNCARTCNRCSGSGSGSGTGTSCTNANADCATWAANGFCSSTFYTNDQKRQYCASSCGLC